MFSFLLIVGAGPRACPADICNAVISGQPQGVAPTIKSLKHPGVD